MAVIFGDYLGGILGETLLPQPNAVAGYGGIPGHIYQGIFIENYVLIVIGTVHASTWWWVGEVEGL